MNANHYSVKKSITILFKFDKRKRQSIKDKRLKTKYNPGQATPYRPACPGTPLKKTTAII